LPARFVPPSGFGYPLDGLLPSVPRRPYFMPAALLGFALRSFLLLQGIRTSPPGSPHIPFLPPFLPAAKTTGRSRWAAVSGLRPLRESLAIEHVFSTPTAGCSPGIHPSWANQPASWLEFRRASSHALTGRNDARLGRRRLRVSIDARLTSSLRRASTTPGRDNPLRVFAPASIHCRSGAPPSGL
jgi:hypothetical protein